ncbi:MAG: FAD-dependent oxidoreductase [Oscillospiraceae bacterium]|nr:FAD-dependent oxidoreductase [Oscillospiraceae bacterium]
MAKYGSEVVSNYSMPGEAGKKAGSAMGKTVAEASREVPVIREADVIVVGGGPGGVAAAVSAARGGASVLLIERYGHLGGMATGGLVNIIPNLGNIYGEHLIGGFCQEVIDRLAARGAASYPQKQHWGKGDKAEVDKYLSANMMHFYIRKNKDGEYIVLYTAVIDPEVGKDELNAMVLESGAELLLHTWVTEPIMEGGAVKGVITESKSGRQAILGKVIIDCSGDGDLLPKTGTQIDDYMVPGSRIAQFGWVYWICGVDLDRYYDFMRSEPEKHKAAAEEITKEGGLPRFSRGLLDNQDGVVWIHRLLGSLHQTDIEEMTQIDVATRKQSVRNWELLKKHMPGFEKSFIMLSSPQLGTSGGRRIIGEYYMTEKDMNTDVPFEDTIAIFADNDRGDFSLKYPRTYIPYRSLVPRGVEGLLVACRAFSSDFEFQEFFNLIPHCMCFGQAAGSAAAIAVKDGVAVRDVDYSKLRVELLKYGAILP